MVAQPQLFRPFSHSPILTPTLQLMSVQRSPSPSPKLGPKLQTSSPSCPSPSPKLSPKLQSSPKLHQPFKSPSSAVKVPVRPLDRSSTKIVEYTSPYDPDWSQVFDAEPEDFRASVPWMLWFESPV